MSDNWKIQALENSLREIHEDFERALIVDGEIEIYFKDVGYPSVKTGFIYKSPTRNLLEELEELLLEIEDA
jgi:hypothetical protein